MNIGFEAKRIFHNRTGLGNYSRDLVRILSQYFPENKYFLYNPIPTNKNLFKTNNSNIFEKKPNSNFYSRFYNIWRQKGVVKDLLNDEIILFHGLSVEIPRGLNKTKIKPTKLLTNVPCQLDWLSPLQPGSASASAGVTPSPGSDGSESRSVAPVLCPSAAINGSLTKS